MKRQLKAVAESYNKAIDYGRKGINLYDDLPDYITSHKDYPKFSKLMDAGNLSDSGRAEVKDYLSPTVDMQFVDLGCCLNLMFNEYDKWSSTYHGVDISNKTIELLEEFVDKNTLRIGSLYCGSIHDTPFESEYFDIGSCIGILEYYEDAFVIAAIKEAFRILKPGAKFVLDIPNIGNSIFEITRLIEEHLGRPDMFTMSADEFQVLIDQYFEVITKENVAGMIQYFLVRKE